MLSFQEYKEQRKLEEFASKFYQVCESIAISGKTFNEFWKEEGLPTLLREDLQNGDQYLDLILEGWFGDMLRKKGIVQGGPEDWKQRPQAYGGGTGAEERGMYGGFGGDPSVTDMRRQQPDVGGPRQSNAAPAQAMAQADDPELYQKQQQVDSLIKDIGKEFKTNLRSSLNQIATKSKQNNDRYSWQVAKLIYNKVDHVLDNLKIPVSRGADPMRDKFSQDRSAMQQNMQQQRLAQRAPQMQQRRAAMNKH